MSGLVCTGTELKLISSALSMGLHGHAWMKARVLAQPCETELQTLAEHVHAVCDQAWSEILSKSRIEVIRRRRAVTATIDLPPSLREVVAGLLESCVDDEATAADLSPFTGVPEYGVLAEDFRALAERIRKI